MIWLLLCRNMWNKIQTGGRLQNMQPVVLKGEEMKKIKFETMTPSELLQEQVNKSIVYVPIGSMEWHGPHMGMGMDTENACYVAHEAAKMIGGTVMPPFYIGTETKRNKKALKKLGFDEELHIVGMDFPENTVRSMYWPPELFEQIIRQQIRFLSDMGYRLIVLVNGHGADRQLEILEKIAEQFSDKRTARVISIMILFDGCGVEIGHAGLAETAIMQAICPEGVDLTKLPAKPEKLYNTKYAIVDNETFLKGPNEDYSVRYDPRDATPELGQKLLKFAVDRCVKRVTEEYEKV